MEPMQINGQFIPGDLPGTPAPPVDAGAPRMEAGAFVPLGVNAISFSAPEVQAGAASIGKIDFIDNAVDATTGTIKIKGTFPNDDRRLWPGQFVNVTVTLTTDHNVTVVPTAAVQSGQQGTFVYVVKPDKTVDLRLVTVTRTRGEESILRDGVRPGETIVIDGQLRLVPGTRVSIKDAAGNNQKASS